MAKIIKSFQAAPGAFSAYECDSLGLAVATLQEPEYELMPEVDPIARAEAEAEQRVQELYEEGLRRGYEAGQEQFRESVGEALRAFTAAADALRQARDEFLASSEPQVLALVRAITERILFREAKLDPEVVANTVRAALRNLTDRERLTVAINPGDLAAVRREQLDLFAGVEGLEQVELTGSESVGPGGCIIESEHVRVDARLDAQLDQVLRALAG